MDKGDKEIRERMLEPDSAEEMLDYIDKCTHFKNARAIRPEEHTYTVHVESGIPSDCTCPAFEYQVAVAIREPVLGAATAEPAMRQTAALSKQRRATTPTSDQTTATVENGIRDSV